MKGKKKGGLIGKGEGVGMEWKEIIKALDTNDRWARDLEDFIAG